MPPGCVGDLPHRDFRCAIGVEQSVSFLISVRKLRITESGEQREIADEIKKECEKVENGIAIKELQIAALKKYKTSLINAAVTGKIKVI